MLEQINLQNFKCFEQLKLPLAELTLLSGTNASGKSSVLQAMVLLHQTMREHEWSARLMLNGESIRLGTMEDVVDKIHGRRSFGIGCLDSKASCRWIFSGERSEMSMSMSIDAVFINGEKIDSPKELQFLLPRTVDTHALSIARRVRDLTYITAERSGPREVYALEDKQVATVVGPAGEHAVSVLHRGRDEKVLESLVIDGVSPTRMRQVEARMRTFFPGCGLLVQQVPQTNFVTLGLRTSDDTDFHRPIHVGFGLTQVFPIIVAALSAKVGDILLIENPEVHLHPGGQALMGRFLAEVAKAGVQVIVETHSDHVLNGLRRSVRAGCLSPEQIKLYFFQPRSLPGEQVVSPQMAPDGGVDFWPEGFFDQFDKDINHFAGWGD